MVRAAREECPFCGRIERGEYDDFNRHCVSFEPLRPVTPGHRLVVPREHTASALTSPLLASQAFGFAAELARLMKLEDFNLITSAGARATQTVFHLHVHVVPRFEGDDFKLPWTGQER